MSERLSDERLRWLRDAAAIDGLPRPDHDRLKQQHAKGMRDVADALDELLALRAGAIKRGGQDIGKLREKIINELWHCPIRDDGIAAAADRILTLLTPADTVRVRIAVAVARDGVQYEALGSHYMNDDELSCDVLERVALGARVSFITADVPKPQPPAEITGRVE